MPAEASGGDDATEGEDPAAGELAPLLPKEEATSSNTTMPANFGTVTASGAEKTTSVSAIGAARDSMGETEYARRLNTFSTLFKGLEQHTPLRVRKEKFHSEGEKTKKMGCWDQLMVSMNSVRDINPVLRKTIEDINTMFGSGISSLFYDWRWLILINLLVWLVWFVFAIFPWISNPPRFEHSSPPWANFWEREDVSFSSLLTGDNSEGKGMNSTTAAQDSFFFYTGYVPHMMSNSDSTYYPMGPAWVGCTIATMVLLFANINGRLITCLKMRKADPDVESMVDAHMSTVDRVVGREAQTVIFGGYDYSCYTLEGQHGSVKALLTGLESLLVSKYAGYGVPAHLRMGGEVFEIKCCVPGVNAAGEESPSILTYQQKGSGTSVSDCLVETSVFCRKLEAGRASDIATEEELKLGLEEYFKENPDASSLANDDAADLSEKSAQTAVTKCILQYGTLWQEPHASNQQSRIDSGEWSPPKLWIETAQNHANQIRPAFTVAVKHGEATSSLDYVKQSVGLFVTLICFLISGAGVYGVTSYSQKVTELGGPYAVTVILVVIQNIIPVVVKMLVLWEGWSSEELVMRWTLGRVYVLKMANLVVLLTLLEKIGANAGKCASLEVGMYLYQLVITGSIMSMAINWASFYFSYRFAGKTGADKLEYDNQTVAQQYIELNYNTALVWIGYTYSPMLPLVAAGLGMVECMWLAQLLKWFCKCAEKPFQATANTKMLVMMIFFTTFAYSCIPTCTFLFKHPSVLWLQDRVDNQGNKMLSVCGPIGAVDRRYQVLVTFLLGWFPTLEEGLHYATNPAILFGIIAMLCVSVAYNSEATGMVREECVESYVDKANSEAYLREKSIQNNILQREKDLLEGEVSVLKQHLLDIEAGHKKELEAKKSRSFFGGGSTTPSTTGEKNKPAGCWG